MSSSRRLALGCLFLLVAVSMQAAVRDFTPAQFDRSFVLESDAARVMLQPAGARGSTATAENNGVAYRGAFRGVDVVRSGMSFESAVARDRDALESIAYEITDLRGIIAVVPFERGVRFVTGNAARDIIISAPLLIDATGRPSTSVRWVISPNGSAGHGTLHLKTNDSTLRYPVKTIYSIMKARRPALSRDRLSIEPVLFGTGSITGVVTDAVSGAPIVDEFVIVFDSAGNFAAFGITDSSGAYFTFDGLDTGSYRVFVAAANYVPELYDDIPCSGCDFTTGTPVAVTDGAQTSGIDVALTPLNGRISGTVTGGASPLADVVVVFYDNTDNAVGSATTDASGFYQGEVLAAGTPFRARTFNTANPGFLDQLYNGIDCGACPISSGTAINVSPGLTTSGINFSLSTGGRIAGSVDDISANPIYQAQIDVYNSSGALVTSTQSDPSGDYITLGGLSPGTYFVVASAFGHGTELYDNIPCSSCTVTSGTAVSVVAGQTTNNISFALSPDTVPVSGRVTDAVTTLGLANVLVLFYDSSGVQVAVGSTDGSGNYATTLAAGGTYYALTSNSAAAGYIEQLYDDIDCSGCDPLTGTPIIATAGTPITGIDFALRSNGGSISGSVTDFDTTAGIGFATVAIYSASGNFVTHATADTSGNYLTFDDLAPGTYYATASASGYATQLYQNFNCAVGCDPTTGTAIVVTAGQTTTGINFALKLPFARLTGTVLNAADSGAIANATVTVYDSAGNAVASTLTDANGVWVVQLSEGGTYYATAAAAGFATQLYNGLACNGCDPTTGTPITATVGDTTANINFLLQTTACAGITVEPPTLPNGQVSVAYSATVTTSGPATAPVTFTVTSGDLPDGLTLSSGGSISGTPSAAGTFTFVITATDANNCSAARSYTIEIAPIETPTTTTLTASPNPAIYLDTVTLTATVTPSGATGSVSFFDGATSLGSAALDANGVATIAVSTFTAGTHSLSATYAGDGVFAPSTGTVSLVVEKKNPTISWPEPDDITYPTALSGTQLNATAEVSGTFVYTPAAGTVLDAGDDQLLSVTFTPDDAANYTTATATVFIDVLKGTPVITWDPEDYTFGTPLGPDQLNATADVPGTFTYDPPAGTILPAGTQTISAHFTPTDTANYNEVDVTVSLNGAKATPVFSNLSAPTIIIGTASTAISGKLSFGTFIPTGSVDITLNGVTQPAAIQPDGTFSSTFATASLVPPSYPITFAYAGDSNFNPASATTTLTVRYGTTGERISNGGGGGTIPLRVFVFDANNVSLASPSLPVTVYGIRLVSSSTWTPWSPTAFEYQTAQGGSYRYNLQANPLPAGNYVLGYTIGNDTTIYTISFTTK